MKLEQILPTRVWTNQPSLDETIDKIRDQAAEANLGLLHPVVEHVLSDPRFKYWPASKKDKHHARVGGLAQHTEEVIDFAMNGGARGVLSYRSASCGADKPWIIPVHRRWLFVGCLLHDYGKTIEYDVDFEEQPQLCLGWKLGIREVKLSYSGGLESHVTSSARMFRELVRTLCNPGTETEFCVDGFEDTIHAIHAHHGFKAWGSPVSPRTANAMILHQADMMSVFYDTGSTPMDR